VSLITLSGVWHLEYSEYLISTHVYRQLISHPVSFVLQPGQVDLNVLAHRTAKCVVEHDIIEPRQMTYEDDALIGLLNLATVIMKHGPPFQDSQKGRVSVSVILLQRSISSGYTLCIHFTLVGEDRSLPHRYLV
jgi:hypothetical protein